MKKEQLITNDGKWLALGYYGGKNTGDDAILQGLLTELGSTYSKKIIVISRSGEPSPYLVNLGFIYKPFKIVRIFKEIISAKGIVQAGGTIFHDNYPRRIQSRYYQNLILWTMLFWFARFFGKKVLMIGVGIGPFLSPYSKMISIFALKACHMISLRDASSLNEIKDWIPSHRRCKTFDLAILLNKFRPPSCRRTQNTILGISTLSFADVIPENNFSQDFMDIYVASLITLLDILPDLNIRVYVMWAAKHRKNDIVPSEELVYEIERQMPGRAVLVPYRPDPMKTFQSIFECKAFVATRLHSVVLAYAAGCSIMTIPYHRKVIDFSEEIMLDQKALIFPSKKYEKPDLVNKLRMLISGDKIFEPKLPFKDAVSRSYTNIVILKQFMNGVDEN
jgi:polysaccharide pyruvyl transferase WcaK-like protein